MSLLNFFKNNESTKKTIIDKSLDWMKNSSQVMSKNLIKEYASRTEKVSRWGHIYQFVYDAKTKSKLKYYDIFPMSIVIEKYKNGFLGLNLHYLPLTMRFAFMDQLWEYVSDGDTDSPDEDIRFILRYKMLASISGKKYYRPCLKRYLYTQMRTPMYHIPADKWTFAMVLPSAKFFDSNDGQVMYRTIYLDSRNSVINNK